MSDVNWRELPAGPELDKVIAERAGWQKPSGRVAMTLEWHNRDDLLEPPKYSTNANAALTLPLDNKADLGITVYRDGSVGVELLPHDQRARYYDGVDSVEKFALAICLVWLAWKDGTANG